MRNVIVFLFLLFYCGTASAVTTPLQPTGVSVSAYTVGRTANLYWNNDPAAIQWYIYFNNNVMYSPTRAYVALTSSSRVIYTMTSIPLEMLPTTITVRSLYAGSSLSPQSLGVVLTSYIYPDYVYVQNAPGTTIAVTGGGGSGGSDVTVTSSVLPDGAATEATLSAISGKLSTGLTITAISSGLSLTVKQGSPWTVSGSVGVTSWPSAYQSVSINAGTNYIGAVNLSNTAASPAQVSLSAGTYLTIGGSPISTVNPVPIQPPAAGYLSVNTSNVGGNPTAAGNGVATAGTQRVAVASDNTPFWVNANLTNTVTVAEHSVTQGSPWIVSGSVAVTSAPLSTSLPAYTNSSPLPVSATLAAIVPSLSTTDAGMTGLNVANAIDYDGNSLTVFTKRGAPTTNTYLSTSGTTQIWGSGYGLLYSITVNPASIPSTVTLFDGSVTRLAVSGTSSRPYSYARGVAFTSGMTVVVSGDNFDGGISLETTR